MKRFLKIVTFAAVICTLLFGCRTIGGMSAKRISKDIFAKTAVKLISRGTEIGNKVYTLTKHYVVKGYKSTREALNNIVPKEYKTRNYALAGKTHGKTNVLFVKRVVKDADGRRIKGVFPVFESTFNAKLPKDMLLETDGEQFAECNRQLAKMIEKDLGFAKKFTKEQLEQIRNLDTPDGFTWHHHEETGRMQLVEKTIHLQTGHTGGRQIWGGGTQNR